MQGLDVDGEATKTGQLKRVKRSSEIKDATRQCSESVPPAVTSMECIEEFSEESFGKTVLSDKLLSEDSSGRTFGRTVFVQRTFFGEFRGENFFEEFCWANFRSDSFVQRTFFGEFRGENFFGEFCGKSFWGLCLFWVGCTASIACRYKTRLCHYDCYRFGSIPDPLRSSPCHPHPLGIGW